MKIKIISAILLFAALFAGCSKGFLDKKPLGNFGEGDVFSDPALLNAYILSTYRGMGYPFGNTGYDFTESLTDNAYTQTQGDGGITTYAHGEVTRDNGENTTRGLWTSLYGSIRQVNVYFEKTAGSTLDPAVIKTGNGEMRFLRAFFYAKLIKWYGGVPLITASAPLGLSDYGVARSSFDEVTNFIVGQCDSAITDLSSFASVDKGRISKEAAMALKARVLLYAASPLWNETNDQAKWQKASDANKAVMDITSVGLLSSPANYHNIFNGRNNEEVILARYFTPQNPHTGGDWGSNLWLYPNSFNGWGNVAPTQDFVDAYELTNGKLPSDPSSGYDPQNPYVNRDPRFAESVLFNGGPFLDPILGVVRPMEYYRDKNDPTNVNLAGRESISGPVENFDASRTRYNYRKYTDEGKPGHGDGGDKESLCPYIYFRKSEAYLNYAECQIALGNENEAKTAINAIRARVNMPAVTESGSALIARYRNERRIEFVLEDMRFDDVRRWKIGPASLGKPAMGVDIYKNGSTIEYIYNFTVDAARKWDDRMYLLPIPFSDIQASNGKLTQNPGYQ